MGGRWRQMRLMGLQTRRSSSRRRSGRNPIMTMTSSSEFQNACRDMSARETLAEWQETPRHVRRRRHPKDYPPPPRLCESNTKVPIFDGNNTYCCPDTIGTT